MELLREPKLEYCCSIFDKTYKLQNEYNGVSLLQLSTIFFMMDLIFHDYFSIKSVQNNLQ